MHKKTSLKPLETEEALAKPASKQATANDSDAGNVKEYGGPKGLEPTRYGDWEKNGRCTDF